MAINTRSLKDLNGRQLAPSNSPAGGAPTEHDQQQLVDVDAAQLLQATLAMFSLDSWVTAAIETGGGVDYTEEITISYEGES